MCPFQGHGGGQGGIIRSKAIDPLVEDDGTEGNIKWSVHLSVFLCVGLSIVVVVRYCETTNRES